MADLPVSSTPPLTRTRIVVATTVLLSFISFWRAAAIVLNDLGSSAFYAVGIAGEAFGKSAPWFILGVMLFSYAVRAVYIESCVLFTRGGVYRVVKEAMGGTLGKLAVSALMFDYILTGPISGATAGQYLAGFLNDLGGSHLMLDRGWGFHLPRDLVATVFAVGVTVYFWRKNVRGLHESSERALQIMYVVTAMVVTILVWSGITLLSRPGISLPPLPSRETLHFSNEALGWLKGTSVPQITVFAFLIAFGHSILAMSGEETLAQVNREIEHPKLQNLKRAGMVIFIYSLVFTGFVSLLAVMIIPDAQRHDYTDNMISGLAMNLAGPLVARLALQAFVVVVGILMLAGAVNTAIIGSNGVMNRVAEDGILTNWFRRPHPRFGSTSRIISMVAFLQLAIILGSRGDVYLLGEAYAFGVIWSFTLMTVSILVLRFKQPSPREWRVPGNVRMGRYEIPLGLALIALALFSTAVMNLLTKRVATLSGLAFSALLFAVFTVSERITARRRAAQAGVDQFQLHHEEAVTREAVGVRPGNILVPVRDHHTLDHLRVVLERTDTEERDIVAMTTRLVRGGDFAGEFIAEERLISEYEQMLFSRAVSLAEKAGKPVSLCVVPGTDPFEAMLLTAQRLQSAVLVLGQSHKVSTPEQARLAGLAWEKLPHPRPHVELQILAPGGRAQSFVLGPHAPHLRPEDVETLHRLWLELSADPALRSLHHNEIVAVALRRLAAGLRRGPEQDTIFQELRRIISSREKPPSR